MSELLSVEDVEYTVGAAERGEVESDTSPEKEIELLKQALANAVQGQAELQEEIRLTHVKYEKKMQDMVSKDAEKHPTIFIKAIDNAMKYMDNRQDEHAYRTLEAIIKEYGEEYGFKEFDPFDPRNLGKLT